jgi:hypothetical protein
MARCICQRRRQSAITSYLDMAKYATSGKLEAQARFDEHVWGRRFLAQLKHLIEDGFVWPKLEKLELGGFQTSESRLVGLLERHASTLRIFGLQ